MSRSMWADDADWGDMVQNSAADDAGIAEIARRRRAAETAPAVCRCAECWCPDSEECTQACACPCCLTPEQQRVAETGAYAGYWRDVRLGH